MFDTSILQNQHPFSLELNYSLTAEHFIITEMTNLQQQTKLLYQIASRQKNNSFIEDEKQMDATTIQSNSRVSVFVGDAATQEKVSLFTDCKIRRIQEQDQILNEIKKRCSSNCYIKVKQVFQNQRHQNKILKQLQAQLEQNHKINSELLRFKQENQKLKAQLQRSIQSLNEKQDDKGKLKVLQQRNINKQTLILKNEKNLILKQKKIAEMKKKVQLIFDRVDQELQKIYKQVYSLKQCLRQGQFQNHLRVNSKISEIAQLWCQFGSSFKATLQL